MNKYNTDDKKINFKKLISIVWSHCSSHYSTGIYIRSFSFVISKHFKLLSKFSQKFFFGEGGGAVEKGDVRSSSIFWFKTAVL